MKLSLAILNTLAASPRALTAAVILGYVTSFTGQDHTLADVERELKQLERSGHVKGTHKEFIGTVWKETEEGRLCI